MGLLDHYRQYEAMTEDEVNAGKRAAAEERKRTALARQDPVDLSTMTWPEYPPHLVVNAITYAARRGLHRYRDRHAGELRAELARRHEVAAERLVIGDGAAQLLSTAARELLSEGDELVTPWPSYGLYPLMARKARAHAVPVPGFGVDAVLRAVNARTRVVALCNPNDPTGELLDVDALDALLGALPARVVVLLDEALRDYADAEPLDATLPLLERHPRLLIFRTFSKAWGLAGLRVGYAIGGPGAEPLLEHLEPELGLDELAQAGALAAVRQLPSLAHDRGRAIAASRRELLEAARAAGLDATPSQTNALWLSRAETPGAALAADLARRGVIVADGARLGDDAHVRMSVPAREHELARTLGALAGYSAARD
ncbi:MAG TPA: aminotransferase class I/II-fold pyridoxal phosphate-dependent enzyme [Solirubrobacteraceae bacterium]